MLSKLDRRPVLETRMWPHGIVQVDNQTPIVPKRVKFYIRGTPGICVRYG